MSAGLCTMCRTDLLKIRGKKTLIVSGVCVCVFEGILSLVELLGAEEFFLFSVK